MVAPLESYRRSIIEESQYDAKVSRINGAEENHYRLKSLTVKIAVLFNEWLSAFTNENLMEMEARECNKSL